MLVGDFMQVEALQRQPSVHRQPSLGAGQDLGLAPGDIVEVPSVCRTASESAGAANPVLVVRQHSRENWASTPDGVPATPSPLVYWQHMRKRVAVVRAFATAVSRREHRIETALAFQGTELAEKLKSFVGFFIEGPRFDDTSAFILLIFRILAAEGDAKRIYVLRGVCKRFKEYIDVETTNAEYGSIYNIVYWMMHGNPILLKFVQRLPTIALEQQQQAAGLSYAGMLRSELERPNTQRIVDPLLWSLLNYLARLAVEAACSDPPQRFAALFTNELRGYSLNSYFGTFMNSKGTGRPNADVEGQLNDWWKETLQRMKLEVTRRAVHPENAEASMRDFVEKMAAIPFHGIRGETHGTPFRELGHELLDQGWEWP